MKKQEEIARQCCEEREVRKQREVRAQGKMVENEREEEREGGELGFEKRGNCSKELPREDHQK